MIRGRTKRNERDDQEETKRGKKATYQQRKRFKRKTRGLKGTELRIKDQGKRTKCKTKRIKRKRSEAYVITRRPRQEDEENKRNYHGRGLLEAKEDDQE